MPLVVVLGLLAGALGAAWTALNTRLLLLRGSYVRRPALKVFDLLLVCLITNTIRCVVTASAGKRVWGVVHLTFQ